LGIARAIRPGLGPQDSANEKRRNNGAGLPIRAHHNEATLETIMKITTVFAPVLLVTVIASAGTAAACGKDTDCKGQRVCSAGRCVTPQVPLYYAPVAAPVPGQPLPGQPHQAYYPGQLRVHNAPTGLSALRGYGSVMTHLSLHGWGEVEGQSWGGKLSEDSQVGLRLSGYGVASSTFHIGGYFGLVGAEGDDDAINFGLAMKVGGWVATNVFLSWAVDLGLERWADFTGFDGFSGISVDFGIAGSGVTVHGGGCATRA
jgi:hypothetical protein